MTDPRRWLDPESDAPEGARELLEQVQPSRPIDKTALALSAAALAKLASAPSAAAALGVGLKLVAATSVVVVAGVVAVQLATPPQRPEPPITPRRAAAAAVTRSRAPSVEPPAQVAPPAPAPVIIAPPPVAAPITPDVTSPTARPRPTPAKREPIANVAPPPVPSPAPNPDVLALEVQLLDQARTLLARDPAAALARADSHAARFPDAALGAERELIAVDALRRLGRHDQARARADALLARHPGSLYRARLRTLLEETP